MLGSEENFAVVMETASLNELDLGAHCRLKGLFAGQISAWRETCRQANVPLANKAERAQQRAEKAEIGRLWGGNRSGRTRPWAKLPHRSCLKKVRAILRRSQRTLSRARTAHK